MYAAVVPLIRTRAFAEPFDYLIPPRLAERVVVGSLVAAPLGSQVVLGVVVGTALTSPHADRALELRDLIDLPPVPGELVEVAGRLARHYITSLGGALTLIAPPAAALRLERTAVLTAAGHAAWQAGRADLAIYADDVPVRGALRADRDLAAGRREGWIEVVYRLRLTEPEREPRCFVVGPGRPTRMGARQKAALELTATLGSCDERTLAKEAGVARTALTSLLAAGALIEAPPGTCALAPQPASPAPPLRDEQRTALEAVSRALRDGGEVLLHGVTGSGKTEVYLRAAAAALSRGRSVLFLVPEIGLTGQTLARVRARFPAERVAVVHSGLSAGERLAAYRAAASGEARIVVGVRSAVFAPLRDLGLIVVDEEHDASYKQESEPRYDARTVARWRALACRAAVVFGSATPSVETWALAPVHVDLTRRVDGTLPPRLEVVDLRDVHTALSDPLRTALIRTVEAGEKAILFLNRRGLATSVSCAHCGHTWTCDRCDVALSLVRAGRELRCRTCGRRELAPHTCPACGSVDVGRHGVGTERLEAEIAGLLPGVDLLRLDSDVAASYHRLRAVLERFASPGPRVLVGTQMIAKGHHFPDVTLVGVVNADLSLYFPDFRAEERTFAMLIQVGGRSGRGEQPGRVIVQTLNPEARPIVLAAAGEDEAFYASELERRGALGYPPATTLVVLEASSPSAEKAGRAAAYVAQAVRRSLTDGEEVVGPGPLWRERGRYASRLLIKSTQIGKTVGTLTSMTGRVQPHLQAKDVRLVVDVEPAWF